MKLFWIFTLLALSQSNAFASTYKCETNDGKTTAEFQFINRVPVAASLTFLGIHHDTDMMLQFMEDYDEIPGQSLYVEVSVSDYGTIGILFDAKFLPGSTTRMTGNLAIFGAKPMHRVPLTCTCTP
jgi:hypothetical protein